MNNITIELVKEVNEILKKDLFKDNLENLSFFHLQILKIIYLLHTQEIKINSKTIYDYYNTHPEFPKREYSRICQIITDLERDSIVYVTTSKSTKLRDLSIHETLIEIRNLLSEKGMI